MTPAFWVSLLSLRDSVDQTSLGAARRLRELRQSGEPETPVSGVVLSHLHLEVRHQLEGWTSVILTPASSPGETEAEAARCLRLVSFWLNERVCSHLDPEDRGDFTPVGPPEVNLHAGGVLFFEEIEQLLLRGLAPLPNGSPVAGRSSRALPREVALFILEQGFSGVHVGDVARLEALKARLRLGALPKVVEEAAEEPVTPRVDGWRLLAWGAVVLAFYICLVWISHGLEVT